jgi:hypothetical protein
MERRNILNDNPLLQIGWPYDLNADHTATWERIEQRAGKKFSHKDRCELQDLGIVGRRVTGRPPNRIVYVFALWPDFLAWMKKKNIEKRFPA